MKITIYAKTAHGKDGKTFIRFLGKMHNRKTGEEITVSVNASKGAPRFDESKCPMNIEYDKADGNLSAKKYTAKDGTEKTSYALWLKNWKESEDKFVDHSLDDFE